MTDILQRRWSPSGEAVESPVGDETVILHLANSTYYGLDAVGTRIWSLLKEGLAPLEICDRISVEYGVAPNAAKADARRFLDDLRSHGIIEEA